MMPRVFKVDGIVGPSVGVETPVYSQPACKFEPREIRSMDLWNGELVVWPSAFRVDEKNTLYTLISVQPICRMHLEQ
jgi:hypothetical protein